MGEFAELAAALSVAPNEWARLQLAADSTVKLVGRCDHAGITVHSNRAAVSRVSSDHIVQQADEWQHELGEGPCLDVTRDHDTQVCPDLAREHRWATWSRRVHEELGLGSMMSLLLYTDDQSYGTLTLYAQHGQRFDSDDVTVGHTIAAHLAIVMTAEREIEHLGIAMVNRVVIGRAEGILMERLHIDADQAFDFLRRVSSQTNRKLVHVAGDIARTRELPHLG